MLRRADAARAGCARRARRARGGADLRGGGAKRAGIDAVYVDATDVIVTERRLGSDLAESSEVRARGEEERRCRCSRTARSSSCPATSPAVRTATLVTLGRGGTDFSAAILARSVGARALTLFKEVDGLMTADPKSVPDARVHRRAALPRGGGAGVLRREGAASAHDDPARRPPHPAVRAQHVSARPAPARASPAT